MYVMIATIKTENKVGMILIKLQNFTYCRRLIYQTPSAGVFHFMFRSFVYASGSKFKSLVRGR
jgi:hypothetical protein